MQYFIRFLILIVSVQVFVYACMGNERLEPADRWKSPHDMIFILPRYRLDLGQILVLHLPLENGTNRWKIPQSGENEEYRWYTEPRLTDQELRIQALKSGSTFFKMKFESANKETQSVAIVLNISTTGVSAQYNPLLLDLSDNGKEFENHPHSPVVVTLENPKGKTGVWQYTGSQKDLPTKTEPYKTEKENHGITFSFKSSFESRTLEFEFIEKDGLGLTPTKAKFTIIPLKNIPKC